MINEYKKRGKYMVGVIAAFIAFLSGCGFPSQNIYVAKSIDGKVVVTNTHKAILHQPFIDSAAFSPNGCLLASSDVFRRIMLTSISDGRVVRVIDSNERVNYMDFSPNNQLLGAAGENIQVWRISDSGKAKTRKYTLPSNRPFVFLYDGKLISRGLPVTGNVQLQSIGNTNPDQLTVSPDGKLIAAFEPPNIIIWSATGGKRLRLINCPDVASINFSSDGSMLVASDGAQWSYVYRLKDGHLLHRFKGDYFTAFSGDGKMLATSYGINILIWNVADGTIICKIPAITTKGVLLNIAFLSHNRLIVGAIDSVPTSPKNDYTVRAFACRGNKAVKIYSIDHRVLRAISPDGNLIAFSDPPSGW